MRWRDRYCAAVAATAVIAAVAVAGCSSTVSGNAHRAQQGVPDPGRDYGYVDDRCGLLLDATVQQTLGADHIVRPYSGAVCQYVLVRGVDTIDVTFSWFETGTLDRERALATERGATVTDTDVERHKAFLARRDTTGIACSATAAAGPGVLSWWVQFRGHSADEPCKDAEQLLSATLQSDL
jgi:Protein of unknown function (DUF3558)